MADAVAVIILSGDENVSTIVVPSSSGIALTIVIQTNSENVHIYCCYHWSHTIFFVIFLWFYRWEGEVLGHPTCKNYIIWHVSIVQHWWKFQTFFWAWAIFHVEFAFMNLFSFELFTLYIVWTLPSWCWGAAVSEQLQWLQKWRVVLAAKKVVIYLIYFLNN